MIPSLVSLVFLLNLLISSILLLLKSGGFLSYLCGPLELCDFLLELSDLDSLCSDGFVAVAG